MEFTRYAIYFTPSPGPLAEFGAAWLGWDVVSAIVPPAPNLPSLPLPREEITESPHKYGFHATIKPPFRLAEGQTEDALQEGFIAFCAATSTARLEALDLAQLGRFLALVPVGETDGIDALAAGAVRALDGFRARPTEAEIAMRRASGLSPRQDTALQTWGYPYVMEDFRFHMTLTGKLPKAQATALRPLLSDLLAPLLPSPFDIDALSLVGEGPDGMFRLIDRVALSGAS